MIEKSEQMKSAAESKAANLADKLVPYTFAGSILSFLLTRNILRALSVLMVDLSLIHIYAIPIQRIWPDGIFQVGSRFSKTFSFTDINYQIAGKEDKTAMFLDYSELLNALDSGASAKITINNRKINKAEFEKSLLLPMKEDGLNHFRKEYNLSLIHI